MRTNQELRTEIIYKLVKAYKEVRRVERQLNKPTMKRVFRTKCKGAKKQAEMKQALLEGLADAEHELLTIWWRLPEIRSDVLPLEGELTIAKAFAAKCAKRPSRRKFVKGQMILEPMTA